MLPIPMIGLVLSIVDNLVLVFSEVLSARKQAEYAENTSKIRKMIVEGRDPSTEEWAALYADLNKLVETIKQRAAEAEEFMEEEKTPRVTGGLDPV